MFFFCCGCFVFNLVTLDNYEIPSVDPQLRVLCYMQLHFNLTSLTHIFQNLDKLLSAFYVALVICCYFFIIFVIFSCVHVFNIFVMFVNLAEKIIMW